MLNTQATDAPSAESARRKSTFLLPRAVAAFVICLSGAVAFNALVLQRSHKTSNLSRLEAGKSQEARDSARQTKALEPKEVSEEAERKALAARPRLASTSETDRRLELTAAHLEELDPATPQLVKAIQRELMARGFDPGGTDGQNGMLTRAAILSFEFEEGLPLTGEPSQVLLRRLVLGTTLENARANSPQKPDAATLKLVKAIQHALSSLQYAPGPADGTLKAETVRAIREFEMDQGLSPTGRISGRFIGRLARVAGRNFELSTQ